jgi:S-DNA-T family DNA segregation ATPase FtsK/SpoIIIE
MAYSRDRAPLLDTRTQAALERRGRELLGLGLLGLGLFAAVMLATYSPDDPNWMTAGARHRATGSGPSGPRSPTPS